MFTVIVVDDEIMIKRSLTKLIESSGLGFTVVGEAEDGSEALELCDRLRPDLLVTDISMPVMDGLELIGEVRRRKWDMDIFILSGYDDFAYAQQALRYGVTDYLLKPVKEEQVQQLLTAISAKRQEALKAKALRSKWLKEITAESEAMAELLWLLNEQEARQRLKVLHDRLQEDGAEGAWVRSRLEDVLGLVEAGLQEKAAGGLGSLEKLILPSTDDPQSWLEASYTRLELLAVRIRESRNWGQRHTITKAAAFIEAHFSEEDLSLQRVADEAGMSPTYFSRCFKEELNMSFIDYIIRLRMEKAKELLAGPDIRTTEAAYAVGYGDYPHFAKSFKKYCGLSPGEYKKRMAGGGRKT